MTSLLFAYESLFPTGEIADKLSILLLKLERLEKLSHQEVTELEEQCLQAWRLLSEKFSKILAESQNPALTTISFLNAVAELIVSNNLQWNYENDVRSLQTADAAVRARKQNKVRVDIKNALNRLLVENTEKKQYPEIRTHDDV